MTIDFSGVVPNERPLPKCLTDILAAPMDPELCREVLDIILGAELLMLLAKYPVHQFKIKGDEL